jgi:hypothetical protein
MDPCIAGETEAASADRPKALSLEAQRAISQLAPSNACVRKVHDGRRAQAVRLQIHAENSVLYDCSYNEDSLRSQVSAKRRIREIVTWLTHCGWGVRYAYEVWAGINIGRKDSPGASASKLRRLMGAKTWPPPTG